MKVEAYQCDYCGNLRHAVETVGVTPIEDLFDRMNSFPTTLRPEKTDIHYCITCANTYAMIPAQNRINRKKDENGYKLLLKELLYLVRAQSVTNYNLRKLKKVLHK